MIRDRALILSLVAATLCGLLLTPRLSLAEEGPPAETAAPRSRKVAIPNPIGTASDMSQSGISPNG